MHNVAEEHKIEVERMVRCQHLKYKIKTGGTSLLAGEVASARRYFSRFKSNDFINFIFKT